MLHKFITYVKKPQFAYVAILVLYALCFFYFFNFKAAPILNNIDGSWPYSLSGLRHSSQQLGVDVFFNYGPLFQKVVTTVHTEDTIKNFLVGNLFFFAMLAMNLYVLYRFLQLRIVKKTYLNFLLFFTLFVFLTITALDTLFYLSLFFTVFLLRKEGTFWKQLLLLVGIQLFSLYKFSFSFAYLILSLFVFFDSFKPASLVKSSAKWLASLATYALVFLIVTSSLSFGFFRYFYYGIRNAFHYNEFMSLTFSVNKYVVLFYFACLLTIATGVALILWGGFRKDKDILKSDKCVAAILLLGVVFLTFKQSVVRSDGHLLAFTPLFFFTIASLGVIALSVPPIKRKLKRIKTRVNPILVLLLVLVVGLSLHFLIFQIFSSRVGTTVLKSRVQLIQDATVYGRLNYSLFRDKVEKSHHNLQQRKSEIVNLQAQLEQLDSNQTILVYGNTTVLSELLADDRHQILQAPFLQNYAAHPPTLFDDVYIDFLRDNPDALVFVEETEGSVNERLVSHELNNFFRYLVHNYEVVAEDSAKRQYLLQKVDDKTEQCEVIENFEYTKDTVMEVPSVRISENEYIKLLIDPGIEPIETLLSFVIKKPVYNLSIFNKDGARMDWRTTQTTLEHGVAVKPLFLNYHDAVEGTQFNLRSFMLSGGLNKKQTYKGSFELCRYN